MLYQRAQRTSTNIAHWTHTGQEDVYRTGAALCTSPLCTLSGVKCVLYMVDKTLEKMCTCLQTLHSWDESWIGLINLTEGIGISSRGATT